jgi:hypothetical protein
MESLAQKKARANFKKAIEYRKKTGCSLKEAFAHVSGKKTVSKKTVVKKRSSSPLKKKAAKKKIAGYVKTIKKGNTTDVLYSRIIKSKKSAKPVQKTLFGVKKKAAKKPSEKSILNKIHLVKKDVDKLDEAQHKHMSIGSVKNDLLKKIKFNIDDVTQYENRIKSLQKKIPSLDKNQKIIARHFIKQFKLIISEIKTNTKELKKHI